MCFKVNEKEALFLYSTIKRGGGTSINEAGENNEDENFGAFFSSSWFACVSVSPLVFWQDLDALEDE